MKTKSGKFIIVFVLLLGFVLMVYLESSKQLSDNEQDTDYLDEPIVETANSRSSSILTFEELSTLVAKDFSLSLEEAKFDLLSMYEENEIEIFDTKQFVSFTMKIDVSEDYIPTLRYYAEVNYNPEKNAKSIERLLKLNFNNEDYRNSKDSYQFNGRIFTHVQDDNRIYYRVSGDFYKKGEMDPPTDLNISFDENKSLNFEVESPEKYYKSINQEGKHDF